MNSQIETRSYGKPLELREVNKPGFLKKGLRGYAIVYGVESRDMGGWKEIIARGAMTESLTKGNDVRLLYQHDSKQPMARESSGTLTLREDDTGILFEADLTDTTLNRDVLANIEARNLDAMSFGMPYASVTAKWERSANQKYDVRTVTKADFVEISVVTWAAYEDTSVAARAHQIFAEQLRSADEQKAPSLALISARAAAEKLRYRS
jgi:hypothetical protein